MNSKTTIFKRVIYIIIPLIIIVLVITKLKNNKQITQNKIYQYDKDEAINVMTDTLQYENVNTELSFSGTFEPNKETKISAEIQGKINTILVDNGSVVNKDQALVLLDNSLLKLQLQSIEVQLEGLAADVKRYTILAKADAIQGVQLEKSVLGLKAAKVQKAIVTEQINKTIIKAPFNGVVTAKLLEEGAFAAPGVPLLQITDITNLKFTINVSENDLSQFYINQIYYITVDADAEILLPGKALVIGSKANIGSSFPVQFAVNNTADLKIKSGMFGHVKSKIETKEKGILIPSSAMVGTASQPQVYLIKEGRATLQNIVISKNILNMTVVSNGLSTGDIMVTNGFINLFNGARVVIK